MKAKKNVIRNIIVLFVCLLAVSGMGFYITFVEQPAELLRLEESVKLAQMKEAEVATLLAESAATSEEADLIARKWHARYKTVPDGLTSPEVVGHLSEITQHGFKNFDISLAGVQNMPDYSFYTFRVVGRGYFTSLYRFIWDVENHRNFYRIRDLQLDHIDLFTVDKDTERERMQVMVSFSMEFDAFYGGAAGLSAPEASYAGLEDPLLPQQADRPPVPAHVLPVQRPAINPFFPVVMEQLPPNTYGLVNVEEAELVAIAGDKAVFSDEEGHRAVGVGGNVYLGQITNIDPTAGRVVARLNKGGIIDEIALDLASGEHYRQAIGPVRLAPILD